MGSLCGCSNLALDDLDNVHIVWADDEEGVVDIFYFKLPADSL
jgi:hypothetical protein